MNFFPRTKQEWLSHLVFPFRAYVVIVTIRAVIQNHETYYVRETQEKAAAFIMAGYVICILVFIFAAVIQFIARQRRSAWTSIVFAVGSFITLYFLLPMFALAK